jgi:tetratricopeptide (TPR) repeat protein
VRVRLRYVDYLVTRRLLRKVRVPGAIEGDPLARRLRANLRAASAAAAVSDLAERALRPFAPEYWTIVRRSDIEGECLKVLAAEMYLSLRTMCRMRRAAIEAVGRAIGSALDRRASSTSGALDALRLVGVGRNHLARRSVRDLLRAERRFATAVALDERCVDGWLGLADVRCALGTTLMRDVTTAFATAGAALARCEALAPQRADVLAARGDFLQFARHDRAGARRKYENALEQDEATLQALLGAVWLALSEQDLASARSLAERAIVAAPDALDARATIGIVCLAEGDCVAAKTWFESVLSIEPAHYVARYYLAHALILLGRHERSAEHLAAIPRRERSVMVEAVERYARARGGDAQPAWGYVSASGGDGGAARTIYARAVAYAGLGEESAALGELERAVKAGEAFVGTLAWDPLLRTLHAHPRFGSLVRQLP